MKRRLALLVALSFGGVAACDALLGLDAPDSAASSSSSASSSVTSSSAATTGASTTGAGGQVATSSSTASSSSTGGAGGSGGVGSVSASTGSSGGVSPASSSVTASSTAASSSTGPPLDCLDDHITVCCEATVCANECCVADSLPLTFSCENGSCLGNGRRVHCEDPSDCGAGQVCAAQIQSGGMLLKNDVNCQPASSCTAPDCLSVCLLSANTCPNGQTCHPVNGETLHGVCQ